MKVCFETSKERKKNSCEERFKALEKGAKWSKLGYKVLGRGMILEKYLITLAHSRHPAAIAQSRGIKENEGDSKKDEKKQSDVNQMIKKIMKQQQKL